MIRLVLWEDRLRFDLEIVGVWKYILLPRIRVGRRWWIYLGAGRLCVNIWHMDIGEQMGEVSHGGYRVHNVTRAGMDSALRGTVICYEFELNMKSYGAVVS